MRSGGVVYEPSTPVMIFTTIPVPVFLTSTEALLTGPPLASRTSPVMTPVSCCPSSGWSANSSAAVTTNEVLFTMWLLLKLLIYRIAAKRPNESTQSDPLWRFRLTQSLSLAVSEYKLEDCLSLLPVTRFHRAAAAFCSNAGQ